MSKRSKRRAKRNEERDRFRAAMKASEGLQTPAKTSSWAKGKAFVSDHRYAIAGAAGAVVLIALWPRTTNAAVPPPPPPPPPAPTPTPFTTDDVVRYQASQQNALGAQLAVAAFATVAAGVIYYATSDASTPYRPVHRPVWNASPQPVYHSLWSSWISDW